MLVDKLRSRLPPVGGRRADLCVAAYCHAFDAAPEVRPDGGSDDEER